MGTGDIVLLDAGDAVSADPAAGPGVADDSTLTGESVAGAAK